MFFTADPKKRKVRLLAEAENDLLDAEAALENAKAVRASYHARVQRLRAEVGQPAPTKQVESVTLGDITQIPALGSSAYPTIPDDTPRATIRAFRNHGTP